MTTFPELNRKRSRKAIKRNLWFERIMALLALANFGLVLTNLTYVPFRDFYLREFRLFVQGLNYIPRSEFIQQYLPFLVDAYDTIPESFLENTPLLAKGYDYVKGIQPHPETQEYLETVEDLREQVIETGLDSAATQEILEQLRESSIDLIEDNPFAVANKTGTLETIKERIRNRLNVDSAEEGFQIFWSDEYLSEVGYGEEIDFFESEIAPLVASNYLRLIDEETGDFIDRFWRIDIFFIAIFAAEFLARTYYIHRRHAGLRWIDGMLWRWYDIFLLLPFVRWLRIIPVTVRCNQSDLVDLEPVQQQISQGFVSEIAEDITEVVVVQLINQVQGTIRRGELAKALTQRSDRAYVDINEVNETEELAKMFVQLIVYQVLPKIKPDIEALLQYNLSKFIKESPPYHPLQNFPGVDNLQAQLSIQLSSRLYQLLYDTLSGALREDPVAEELIERLTTHFSEAIGSEIQAKQTLERIQFLLNDLLEEIKINYVQRLSEEDVEELLEQTRRLRQLAETSPRRLQAGR